MKKICIAIATVLLITSQVNAADSKFKTEEEKVSYIIGYQIGTNLKKDKVNISMDILTQSLKDSYSGKDALMTQDEMQTIMMDFQKKMMEQVKAKSETDGKKNKEVGEKFLTANKKKDGVKVTTSGLQYKVIKNGTGVKPSLNDTVETHYRGTLIDGTEFDSSYKRHETVKFPVSGVIKGWTEALQLMNVGSKWELYIPSNLAYGERGAGANIGPDSTLIFEIELVSIQPKKG